MHNIFNKTTGTKNDCCIATLLHAHLYTSYRLTSRSTITEFADTLYKRRRLFFNFTLRSLAPKIWKHFYIALILMKGQLCPHTRRQQLILSTPVFSKNFIKKIKHKISAVSYCQQTLTQVPSSLQQDNPQLKNEVLSYCCQLATSLDADLIINRPDKTKYSMLPVNMK